MQNNNPPIRLVQIEGLRKSEPPAPNHTSPEIELPSLSERDIYRKKAYIGFRKIAGFFHSKHSFGATRRWASARCSAGQRCPVAATYDGASSTGA